MEGTFRNFNQGELYVYSLDPQAKGRKDTLQLMNGKFAFEMPLEDSITLSIIFPNFSELPVFAHQGATVTLSGDASHLRDTEIIGTPDNEQLTEFRLSTNDMTPPEVLKAVGQFVEDHPQSDASLYLINKYYVLLAEPDYKEALRLLGLMVKASPTSEKLKEYRSQLEQIRLTSLRSTLPTFSAVTVDGQRVSNADLQGKLAIVSIWATWKLDGYMQRQLRELKRRYGQRLAIVGICMDPSVKDCRDAMRRDSITWPTICDALVWQSPLVSQLGITDVPDNFVLNSRGVIIARNLSAQQLTDKMNTLFEYQDK